MSAQSHIAPLEPGDVLHHASFGFAMVDDVPPEGGRATLDWLEPNEEAPGRIKLRTVGAEYRLCTPWGFLARSVRVPAGLRAFTRDEPLTALRLLLEDLGRPLSADEVLGWLRQRDLLEDDAFDAWWSDVSTQLETHTRFERTDEGAVSYRTEAGLEEAVHGPLDKAARTFLAQSPAGRFRMFEEALSLREDSEQPDRRALGEAFVEAVLEAAIRKRDIAAILLALRGRQSVADPHAQALTELALTGDPWLSAALVVRRHAPMERALARAAAEPAARPLLRKTFAALSRSQRIPTVVRLLERALTGEAGDEAARYLVDEMLGGAGVLLHAIEQGGVSGQPVGAVARAWPEAHRWLRDHVAGVTTELPSQPIPPLLADQRPLDLQRVWPLSLELARALAHRHSQGRAGGVRSARVGAGDQVRLGRSEDVLPSSDVRTAMRTFLELLIGTLPRSQRVTDDELLAHIRRLASGTPPEWLAVATRCLAADPALRPSNGLDLWEQLARARATCQVREHAPDRHRAILEVAHDTHIGLFKSRLGQINQDAVFFHIEEDVSLLVVADGISVSTAGSGNLASALLVQSLVESWEDQRSSLAEADDFAVERFLIEALAKANHTVCTTAEQLAGGELDQHIPMGTTAVVAVCRGAHLHLATLGDSRAYLVSNAGAAQLTADQNLLDEWLLSWQEGAPIEMNADGHALTGYVGHFDEESRPRPVPPSIFQLTLLPGEVLLLCSDGLTDYAASSAAELAVLIEKAAAERDLGRGCRILTDRANEGGGGDNISVLLARCVRG